MKISIKKNKLVIDGEQSEFYIKEGEKWNDIIKIDQTIIDFFGENNIVITNFKFNHVDTTTNRR